MQAAASLSLLWVAVPRPGVPVVGSTDITEGSGKQTNKTAKIDTYGTPENNEKAVGSGKVVGLKYS